MRSNGCGDLRKQNIDDQVMLCGWAYNGLGRMG